MANRVNASLVLRAVGVAVVVVLAAVGAAYALGGKVSRNSAKIEANEKSINRVERKVNDIWKVFYEEKTGRRRR